MAQTLSKTGITNNSTIQAWQVSQSIDALTGQVAYDIIISGSLNLTGSTITGSTANITSITGSLRGTADTSSVAQSVKVTNNATTNQSYRLLFVAQSGLPNPNSDGYAQPRFDSGSDGSGLYYNPSTDTLNVGRISGSNNGSIPDFVGTASYAISASVASTALNATNVVYTYIGIDDVTFSSSAVSFPIQQNTPSQIYVSQSVPYDLSLNFNVGTNGQIINFTPTYLNSNLNLTKIEITASVNVFGLNGQVVSTFDTANNLFSPAVTNASNLTFQYIDPPLVIPPDPIFPQAGWYLISKNTI